MVVVWLAVLNGLLDRGGNITGGSEAREDERLGVIGGTANWGYGLDGTGGSESKSQSRWSSEGCGGRGGGVSYGYLG